MHSKASIWTITRAGIVTALFLWIIVVVTCAQWRMAPTFDEQNHITRGVAFLRTGDCRLSLDHPPLANLLEALPVAWHPAMRFTASGPAWETVHTWQLARRTLWHDSHDGVGLVHLARLPVLLFTLVLALVVFLWSRELFGPWGGVLSLALFALDPNILAHSGLATTDMAIVSMLVTAIFWLRRYLLGPTRGRLALAGVGVGLALAAKYSGLLVVPIIGMLLLALALFPTAWPAWTEWLGTAWWHRLFRAAGLLLLLLLTAGITLWGAYGFRVERLGQKLGEELPVHASLVQRLPIPTKQFLRGIKAVKSGLEGHRAYLLGMTDNTGRGWRYYFPVAIAAKTPIPALMSILGILVLLGIPRSRRLLALPAREMLLLLIPPAIFLLAAMGLLGISLNLGLRHVLPLYPFLYILAGGWVKFVPRFRPLPAVLGGAMTAQLASVAFAFPHYLPYFNEIALAGGDGYRILIDSNFDWGQDLDKLAAFQQTHRDLPLTLAYFGTTPPEAYGVQCTYAKSLGVMEAAPEPDWQTYHGYFAISVTTLCGGPDYSGIDYRRLLRETPVARAGKSILIYRLTPTR